MFIAKQNSYVVPGFVDGAGNTVNARSALQYAAIDPVVWIDAGKKKKEIGCFYFLPR